MIKESLHNASQNLVRFLTLATVTLFLAACGGGGGGSDDNVAADSVSTPVFVAVDPYIVGAIFQEISEDGHTLLQRSSSTSNEQGQFSFPLPVTSGSFIELKTGSKGMHMGTVYQGMLRLQIPEDGASDMVISPLTTLEANGFTRQEIISLLSDAGLPGLTQAAFNMDPMSALQGQTNGVTSEKLLPLQANMAINALLETLGDFNLNPAALNNPDKTQLLEDILNATIETLNPTLFDQMATDIGGQYGVPIPIDDLIYAAVNGQATMVGRMQEAIATNGLPLPTDLLPTAVQDSLAQTGSWMAAQAELRGGSHTDNTGGETDPGTGTGTGSDPDTSLTSDGQTVYDSHCASCHFLGSYDTSGTIDLTGKSNLINAKLAAGHKNISLNTADEDALITWVDSQTPSGTTTPPTITDGATLYVQECQGCHSLLANTNINTRTVVAIEEAITANLGGMGSIVLTTDQVQAIVDVLPVVITPDPVTPSAADGPSLYDSNCANCHQVATYDTTGTAPDLGGQGSLLADKLSAGHMGLTMTEDDLTTLTAWLNTFTAAVVEPSPIDCTACHAQPPNGVDYPNGAGAHAVHLALTGIDSCATCHDSADHNDIVDLAMPANYDAKTGMAIANDNSTCSNVSCHGGKTTPNWWTGQLAVNSECTSCHAAGASQYNSYNSGDHSDHSRYACTVCHNITTLADQHFSNLGTTDVEGSAAASIGGGSTRITSYNASTRRCNGCHGTDTW